MPTNPNMVAIQTVTVGSGGAANIEFTSIPQTYTDLVIKLSARLTGSNEAVLINFNSSSSNFSSKRLYGTGSATGSSNYTTSAYVGNAAGTGDTASTFANTEIYIPNYTSSNNKSISSDSVTENNGTTAYQILDAGLWSNTAAITSVKLVPNANNFAQYSTATLYGVTNATTAAKATGGSIVFDGTYWYHTFTSSGTFTPTQNLTADYLVVAGGGGGGSAGGGGGAGGFRCTVGATGGGGTLESALSLTAQAYTVTIGAGGTGLAGSDNNPPGGNGSNSVFATITSTGGGGGGSRSSTSSNQNGQNGGSGGGGNLSSGSGGAGTTNQGYAGGAGSGFNSAGGGGAGAVGANGGASGAGGGVGGVGVATIISGTSTFYAGGGGGGTNATNSTQFAAGGNGGGGAGGGGGGSGTSAATAGTANTGGGGGGGGIQDGGIRGASQSGGSGIVIIRYAA